MCRCRRCGSQCRWHWACSPRGAGCVGAVGAATLNWVDAVGRAGVESGGRWDDLRDGDATASCGRAGLTDHPEPLGGFFAFALIVILGYYFASAHTRARYFLLAPLAIGSTALVLSYSRSAALAFMAGAVILAIPHPATELAGRGGAARTDCSNCGGVGGDGRSGGAAVVCEPQSRGAADGAE